MGAPWGRRGGAEATLAGGHVWRPSRARFRRRIPPPTSRVLPRDRYFDPARCGLSSWELELGRPLFYFLPRSNCDDGFCESEKEARRSGDAGSATRASTRFPSSPLGTRALGSCSLSRGRTPQAHCGASLSAPEFISRRPRAPKTPAPRYLVSQPHPAWRRGPAPSFGSTSPRDLLTGSPEGFSARGRVWGFPGRRHVGREGTRRGSAGARLGTSPRPALARQHVCFISELPVFTRNQRGLRILLSGRSLGGGRRGRRFGRRRPRAWWRGARPPPGALAAVAGRERPEVPSSLLRRRPSLPRPPQAAPPPTTPAPPLPAAAQMLRRAEKSNTLEANDRYYHKRGVAQGR